MQIKSSRKKQGFAVLEYLFVLLVFLWAFVALNPYIRRAYVGQMRKVGEGLSSLRQYGSAKTHECVYEAQVWFTDVQTGKASAVPNIVYSQACYDHAIMDQVDSECAILYGNANCHRPCSQHISSQNCFSYVKVSVCSRNSSPGNAGYDCAPASSGSGPPAPTAFCGDRSCNGTETCTTCPADCGACPPTVSCGDGICNGTETCTTCPQDCGACPPTSSCGDGICNGTDNCTNCIGDCPCAAGSCVGGVCQCVGNGGLPDCHARCGFHQMCGPAPNCTGPGHDYDCSGGCNPGSYCANPCVGCVCQPDCAGKNCGGSGCPTDPDPLRRICGTGTCTSPQTCISGVCTCAHNCSGKVCGSDGCGGSCGTCGRGTHCNASGTCDPDTCSPTWNFTGCGAVCGGGTVWQCTATAIQHCATRSCTSPTSSYTQYDCAWDPGCVCLNAGGTYPGDNLCHWSTMTEPCNWTSCTLTPCKTMSCVDAGSGPTSPCHCPSTGTTDCTWMVIQCTDGTNYSSGNCAIPGYDACSHLLF